MLIALQGGVRTEALAADRLRNSECPHCRRVVILKRGPIKVAHFAHKPPTTCAWAGGETQNHLNAKTALRDSFVRRGLRAEVELPVLSTEGDRRADVAVWPPEGAQPVAIEVQHQPIGYDAIERRCRAYVASNVAVIWIGLLTAEVIGKGEPTKVGVTIPKYTPRPWEKWAHALDHGEVWYIDPVKQHLWKGTLKSQLIEVEYNSWFEPGGEEASAGGYSRYSKRWRTLVLDGPFALDDVRIQTFTRGEWTSKSFTIPAGRFAHFIKPASM